MAKREVLTDKIVLQISEEIGIVNFSQLGVHLNLKKPVVEGVCAHHAMIGNPGGASHDLLHKWVDANGRGQEHAQKLYDILSEHGLYSDAVKVLRNVLSPLPSTDNPEDCADGNQATAAVHPENQALEEKVIEMCQQHNRMIPVKK
ncbi:uncharacterized protein [Diadema setosum]|uniref:uncharacterized protein n=1 Tax=Diadema setosum TaxID=31175 RepID=UPI003B3B8366